MTEYDDGSAAFRLRQELRGESLETPQIVRDTKLDEEPEGKSWASFGVWQLVGNGKVTNGNCGQHRTLFGCLNVDLHNRIGNTLDGENFKNKVYVKHVVFSCDKPSCPVCFRKGWAPREAKRIELRLAEASKLHGQIEHGMISIPVKDYVLEFEALREKARKLLFDCGVLGGALVFHGFRYDSVKKWFWSPHFHFLGFIFGGYNRCRRCKGADCYACNGFMGKVYRLYRNTGYIVEVFGERKTVGGTAVYELGHASVDVSKKHFRIVTYFGVASYRELKISDVVKKAWASVRKGKCPICGYDLVPICYCGRKHLFSEVLVHGFKKGFGAWF